MLDFFFSVDFAYVKAIYFLCETASIYVVFLYPHYVSSGVEFHGKYMFCHFCGFSFFILYYL